MIRKKIQAELWVILSLILVGCSGVNVSESEEDTLSKSQRRDAKMGKLFGEESLIFGGGEKERTGSGGIGVNHYLWRASLDTISFMPLRSVDPFGGVIISEWYTPPESPHERFKVDIFILDRQLRADGVKVAIHKQILHKNVWEDAAIDPQMIKQFEEAILTRARQLKINDHKGK